MENVTAACKICATAFCIECNKYQIHLQLIESDVVLYLGTMARFYFF